MPEGYVAVAEADAIITTYLISTDPQRVAWMALSESDKSAYLNQALLKLENIAYVGRKADPTQVLQFPRRGQMLPEAVKNAQALEACASVGMSGEADMRAQLQAQGITSFSAGSLSESYGKISTGAGALFSRLARDLLKPYLLGVAPFD